MLERLKSYRMNRPVVIFLICLSLALVALWIHSQSQMASIGAPEEAVDVHSTVEPILPIPLSMKLDQKKVALGEQLFNDPQLSHNNTISCASCHSLQTGGTDLSVHSSGILGRKGSINAPTVFNADFNFKQFWDGRAETLEDQVDGPTQDPNEMGSNWPDITDKLNLSPNYVAAFRELYADGIQRQNIKDAIATFERSLSTPNSRFDRLLRGDSDALNAEEKEGYHLFKSFGCASCHQGVNAGGNLFQKFGVMGDYFADRGNVMKADLGRFNVTGDEADRHVFKVPSLRNVALTAPYFHDGSAPRLEDAVYTMGQYQLGRRLSRKDIDLIVKFLGTLSGEYRGKSL